MPSQGAQARQSQLAAQPSSQADPAPSTAQQPESTTPGAVVTSQREYPISNSAAGSLQSTAGASPPLQQGGPVQTAMRSKLTEALQPQRCVVHRGSCLLDSMRLHAGDWAASAVWLPAAGAAMSAEAAGALRHIAFCRLVIVDESSQHAGHAAMAGRAGASGESHFRVHVCSDAFQGLNTVKRHRLVYQVRLASCCML